MATESLGSQRQPITNVAELERLLTEFLPNASIGIDNEQQIIIYTNLILIEDNGDLQDRNELDEIMNYDADPTS